MEAAGKEGKATPKPKKKAAAGEGKKEGGKAKGGGDGTPAPKRQKAEAKAAKAAQPEEEAAPVEAFNMKGQMTKELAVMLYGFGDDAAPLPETLDLVEEIVLDYASSLLHKAMDSAAARGKLRRPGAPQAGSAVGPEDILFLVRKDPKKYARAKELLIMDEEIKKAKQVVEVDEAALAAQQ